MPHVSQKSLEKKVAGEIYDTLLLHLTSKGSGRARAQLCSELLTETEQLMLAKRLAIICMLGEGFSFDSIQETLKVSPSTITRVWSAMQDGAFKHTVQAVKKNKTNERMLNILFVLLTGPRPRHAPRWNWIEELK